MDSALWHDQATLTPEDPSPPEPTASLARMSPAARTAYAAHLRKVWRGQSISSPVHDRVADQMAQALESALLEPPGARTIVSLSAPYSSGKSTLVKQWAQGLYRTWTSPTRCVDRPRWDPAPGITADFVPVCYLTLLSESRSKDLYSQILAFAGYPVTGVERALALRAVTALRNHGVRLVILDDAHMLRTSSVTGRATLNAVKHLNTELGELGGVLMLVGADLTGGEALNDPQIRGRLSEHTFAPYEIGSVHGRELWQRFLLACEHRLLPYLAGSSPGLLTTRHAAYLWTRTQGFVGDTTRLLIDGVTTAISSGVPFDRELLDQIPVSQRANDEHRNHRRRTTQRTADRSAV